jgi:Mlc titration factor MtfA (ptsG expression regulator)
MREESATLPGVKIRNDRVGGTLIRVEITPSCIQKSNESENPWGLLGIRPMIGNMLGFGKRARRRRLRKAPVPEIWLKIVSRNVPFWRFLREEERIELQSHIQVFLAEKNFEGCGGLEVTDEIRVTIAAHACLLLLHRNTEYYPSLLSILVYPTGYIADRAYWDENGFVTEEEEDLIGESWSEGSLVISWDDVLQDIAEPDEGYNVILHEFAHQLDEESGESNGAPLILDSELAAEWRRIFSREFAVFQEKVSRRRRTLMDEYAAEDPAEFFAVATEFFFGKPRQMKTSHPKLYGLMSRFFCQDPIRWGR